MKTDYNSPQWGPQPSIACKKCAVPPADGVQAIDVEAANQTTVTLGADLAARWLDSTQSEPLHLYLPAIRHNTPPRHWADLQTGFLARLDQRLRSDLGGQHRSAANKAAMVVMGNSTMNRMLTQLRQTAALIEAQAIVPVSSEGAHQLALLLALVESITGLGRVAK